ncbi:MAG: tetratricopeptide repeat protein, partial [Acidobacteriota bacterium]
PTVTISRVLASAPAPLPAELPGELVELVGRLLEKSPEHRPRDAAEVARRLADVAASLSSADPSSTHASAVSRRALPLDATTFAGDAVDAPVPAARRRVPKAGWVVLVVLVAAGSVGLWRFVESPEAPVPIATHDATEPAASEPIPEAAEGWRALDAYDRFEQIDRAIEVFQARIEASPRDARAADDHIGLARAYWRKFFERTGDPMWLNQAAAVARRAVDLADGTIDESRARTSLGLVLVEMGEIETARDQLVRALALDPSDADAHRGLGAAHQAAERFEAAEASFRRALALRADDRELHDLLGTLHFRLGRYERAEASFRQSIALAPDTVYGYRNLAGVLTVRGELDEAATVLERALTIQSNATLYGNLGTIYFFQGLYSRAADAYEEALDTEYGVYQPVNWANLGDAYRQIPQRRHEASNAFRQAIRLLEARTVEGSDLDDPWQRSLLALYQAKAGLDDEARRTLDGLRADDPRTLLRLVITWEVLGEREQALDRLAAAFEVGLAPVEVEQDPELASLRSDRRFHELLGTLNRVSTRRRNSRHHRPRRRPRR